MAAVHVMTRFYQEIPPITRAYITAMTLTTVAVQIELVTPFQLYFNPKLIFNSHQYWRLLTTFLYYGPVGFNFLFNLVFTYRYCRMLEEEFYRHRTVDFFYMFVIGSVLMTMIAYFVNLLFLGHAFTMMLVYIWSRRNPSITLNFFGLITFRAPYLPWFLLLISLLLNSPTVVDVIGIAVGHFYYFFEDVFPLQHPNGFRLLKTPRFLKVLFDWLELDERIVNEEERPERFNFARQEDEVDENG